MRRGVSPLDGSLRRGLEVWLCMFIVEVLRLCIA